MRHKFSSDQPINSQRDDLLGRVEFARSIASSIKGWKNKDSLVLGLYGDWGCGKSSLKNLVLEELNASLLDKPALLEFEPWQWASQDQLAEAFFSELSVSIGRVDVGASKDRKKRALKIKAFAATLKLGESLFTGLKKLIIIILTLIFSMSAAGILLDVKWLCGMALLVSALGIFGLFTGWLAKISDQVSSAYHAWSDTNHKTSIELKNELSKLLKRMDQSIVVVIDDIDRLSPPEIRLLFQLVKANANFPNLVYFLLFQRDIVEKSLDTNAVSGASFLEKIIQVGFEIPKIEKPRLEKVLCTGLDEIILDSKLEAKFDHRRWANIFIPGLRPLFHSLRDVNRFLSTFSFYVSMFTNKSSFEVNVVDLIAIETLRLFEPNVYKKLFDAKQYLIQSGYSAQLEKHKDECRKSIEGIINCCSSNNRKSVEEILSKLFPMIEWIFGGYTYGSGQEDLWFRELRICHEDIFERYFYFNIPQGKLSQAEIDHILNLTNSRNELVREFRSLNNRGALNQLFSDLEAYKQSINLAHALEFITAIFDVSDEFPDGPTGYFALGARDHASRIVYWFLRNENDLLRRQNILEECIDKTNGLFLPVYSISMDESRENRDASPEELLIQKEHWVKFRDKAIALIKKKSLDPAFRKHKNLAYILYRWKQWESDAEVKQWVMKLLEESDGVIDFLIALSSKSQTQRVGDYIVDLRYKINLKTVEDFCDIQTIQQKLSLIDWKKVSVSGQRAIESFQKALKRRDAGKSDDVWGDDDDD